jgi:hypothetical protein
MATTKFSDGFLESVKEERDRLADQVAQLRLAAAKHQELAATLGRDATTLEMRLRDLENMVEAEPAPSKPSEPLRGREIWETALAALLRVRSQPVEIHYRQWYELVIGDGRAIAGKDPLASFLTQIGRSPLVQRVRERAGYYRVDLQEAAGRAAEARQRAGNAAEAATSADERRQQRRKIAEADRLLYDVARWQRIAETPGPMLRVVSEPS